MRRSLKVVDKAATQLAVRWRWPSPDPRLGMAVELCRGGARDVGDVVGVGQGLAREGLAAEDAPPPLDQVQPGGPDRDEGVLDARVIGQPRANRATAVAGQVVRHDVQVAVWIRLVERLEQFQVARGVARGRRLGQDLSVLDTERAVDPHLVRSPIIIQGNLDPVTVRRPTRRRGEVAGCHRAEFIDTEDGRPFRRVGGEGDDRRPFGAK